MALSSSSENLTQFDQAVLKNLNFQCKFHIKAPKNKFIYIEFKEFHLSKKQCNQNFIKLYSFYSKRTTNIMSSNFEQPQLPFISLCTADTNKSDQFKNQTFKRNMVTAHFFKEANINQALSCYNSKSKVCFMSNELENDLNPYTSLNASNRLLKKEFFNEIVIDIMASELKYFYFELKYHFFEIDFDKIIFMEKSVSRELNANQFTFRRIVSNDKCAFRCPMSKMYNNISLQICLDETLICDNEVDCIFSESDELNCPLKLNVKIILLVLCTVFSFTFMVLLISFLYKNYLTQIQHLNSSQSPKKFKNVKYSKSPLENYVIEN